MRRIKFVNITSQNKRTHGYHLKQVADQIGSFSYLYPGNYLFPLVHGCVAYPATEVTLEMIKYRLCSYLEMINVHWMAPTSRGFLYCLKLWTRGLLWNGKVFASESRLKRNGKLTSYLWTF